MIYFISDVHLGFLERKSDKPREDLLLKVLEKIMDDAEKLYLVGDIFDYWFDYKSVVPKYFYRTLSMLHKMRENGLEIEYVMGNHDFGHDGFFEEELGIKVFGDDIIRTHGGKRFLISHGDGKMQGDTGYKILKYIMRKKISLKLFLTLHPNFGIRLASGSSKKSRTYTDSKNFGKHELMREYAKQKLESGFDYVIMGHRHRPEITEFDNGKKYVNLGEWFKAPQVGMFDGFDLSLVPVESFLNLKIKA